MIRHDVRSAKCIEELGCPHDVHPAVAACLEQGLSRSGLGGEMDDGGGSGELQDRIPGLGLSDVHRPKSHLGWELRWATAPGVHLRVERVDDKQLSARIDESPQREHSR